MTVPTKEEREAWLAESSHGSTLSGYRVIRLLAALDEVERERDEAREAIEIRRRGDARLEEALAPGREGLASATSLLADALKREHDESKQLAAEVGRWRRRTETAELNLAAAQERIEDQRLDAERVREELLRRDDFVNAVRNALKVYVESPSMGDGLLLVNVLSRALDEVDRPL